MRNILICGSPRVGKTTLGKKISESLGYKYINLDSIFDKKQEEPSWPYPKYYDAKVISHELSNFLIDYVNKLDSNYVLEGAYIDIESIYNKLNNTLIIGLTYNDIDSNELFNRIKQYDKNEWINNFNDDVIKEKCDCFINRNNYYTDCFNKLNILKFDVSNNREEIFNNIINELKKEYIGNKLYIKIDRPLGSCHPKYDTIYPVNYGYLPNTKSSDNEEIDCYLLGVNEPVNEYTGTCIAIIKRIDDNDDKLIIVPEGMSITNEEIDKETDFIEKYFKHTIIR